MKRNTFFLTAILSLLFAKAAFTQVTFQKILYGSNSLNAWHAEQTVDTGFIICGQGNSSEAGSGCCSFLLIKTNSKGDTLWTRFIGGVGSGSAYCVQQTNDGGYIASGETWFGAGNADAYLVKTDSTGNPLWSHAYGGIYNDYAMTVQPAFGGGYILLGGTASFGTGATDFDVYLIKTDDAGDTLWTKRFGGTAADEGLSLQQTADSGYIISGTTQSFGAGQHDVYLIKTDVNGNLLWSKTFGGTESEGSWSVKQTTDGGYIIAGTSHSSGTNNYGDVYLIKTNAYGDTLWTKAFGGTAGTDQSYCVQQTNDGGFIVFGETYSFGGHSDLYLVRTDSMGNLLWSRTFGGASFDHGYFVRQTYDGGYIMAGNTNSFQEPGLYFVKTDNNGYSGCNESSPPTIEMTTATQVSIPAATLVSSGSIISNSATEFKRGLTIITLCNSVGIDEIPVTNSFLISPNPSSGTLIVTSSNIINKGTVEIHNVLGEKVFNSTISNTSNTSINLNNVSGGIYFVRVYDGEKEYLQKLIIQLRK